jgi:transposase
MLDRTRGEIGRRRLQQVQEAREFYAALASPVRVGVQACGHTRWFEPLLAELGLGEAARIGASCVRQQKRGPEGCRAPWGSAAGRGFPRWWVPTPEERDVRQLLVHRHPRVRRRTQVKNPLQAIALNHGLQKRRQLWTQAGRAALEGLPLLPFGAQRRQQLLASLDCLDREIDELDRQVAEQAARRPEAVRLMSHPGVGPNTALGLVLTLGEGRRFARARPEASYLGLIPREHGSGGKPSSGWGTSASQAARLCACRWWKPAGARWKATRICGGCIAA